VWDVSNVVVVVWLLLELIVVRTAELCLFASLSCRNIEVIASRSFQLEQLPGIEGADTGFGP